MAAKRTKYGAPSPNPDRKKTKYDLKVGGNLSELNKPIVHEDGTVEVQNLIEKKSDGLGYHSTPKGDNFYFDKKLDDNTTIEYIPKYIDKTYKTTIALKQEVKEAFAVFRNDVKSFTAENLDRYKSKPKKVRKEIDAILKNKNQFIYTETVNGWLFNQPYVDSVTFGPYNYDVKLEVTKDIEMINDLIIIRSGNFADKYTRQAQQNSYLNSGWGYAWVSPHNTYNYSGQGNYALSGTSFTNTKTGVYGTYSGLGFQKKIYHIVNNYPTFALSSKNITIPKGQFLSSGTTYYDIPSFGYLGDLQTQQNPILDDFYYTYTDLQSKYPTGGWDGVIPSGSYFNIETWSTNPKHVGFNGEITVKPTASSDPTCTYSATTTGVASDLDYQQSVRKAIKQAKKKFYRQLNKILISKGIKRKPARMTKYEKLLERVAQNVYDGLSMVRNEQVMKDQGVVTNPLNSASYYDGTSKVYGGTDMKSSYDKSQTKAYRTDGTSDGGAGASY